MPVKRKYEMGAGGTCLCPKCGERIPHVRGTPCQDERCQKCGAKMIREGSYHHELFERKRAERKAKRPNDSSYDT